MKECMNLNFNCNKIKSSARSYKTKLVGVTRALHFDTNLAGNNLLLEKREGVELRARYAVELLVFRLIT